MRVIVIGAATARPWSSMNRPSRSTSTKPLPISPLFDTLPYLIAPEKIATVSMQRRRPEAKRMDRCAPHHWLTAARRLATNRVMENKALAVLVVVAFSGVGVLGDYFLKLASEQPHSLRSPWFY